MYVQVLEYCSSIKGRYWHTSLRNAPTHRTSSTVDNSVRQPAIARLIHTLRATRVALIQVVVLIGVYCPKGLSQRTNYGNLLGTTLGGTDIEVISSMSDDILTECYQVLVPDSLHIHAIVHSSTYA